MKTGSGSAMLTTLRRLMAVALIALGTAGLLNASFAQDEENIEAAPSVPVTIEVISVEQDEPDVADTDAATSDLIAQLMPASDRAVLLELNGAIGPALAHYIVGGIEAAQGDAGLIILEMDTPGGLDTSMREIIQAILASEVPVATYVSPSGSRAASAGAFIMYASHIAAMAPGTAVGAATPVQMGGGESPVPSSPTEEPQTDAEEAAEAEAGPIPEGASATAPRTPLDAKAMNDALALARGLAELRGRDAEFAEAMIRDAESVSSSEALERGIIEFVVRDLDALLAEADGMTVELATGEVQVATAGLGVERVPMNWVQGLIALITDPNVAFILMNFGMLGILIELYNPGSILPGVVGVICLILALYALSVIPFSATGLALVMVGLLLMGAELFVVSGGVLAIGGFIAFAIGAFFLFDSPIAEFRLDWRVLAGTLAVFAVLLFLVLTYALGALRRKISAGPEELIGMTGKVVEWSGMNGIVMLDGENWQSRSDAPLEPGQAVVATSREGNFLVVQGA